MKLRNYLIIPLALGCCNGLKSGWFTRQKFHSDSVYGTKKLTLGKVACSAYSLKKGPSGFVEDAENPQSCTILQNAQQLVTTPPNGPFAKDVWVMKENVSTIPHFLVINTNYGEIEDISDNPALSPPINYGIKWPENGNTSPFLFERDTLSLWVRRFNGGDAMYMWNFTNSSPKLYPNKNTGSYNQPVYMATSHQNGKMFFVGGRTTANVWLAKAYGFIDHNWVSLKGFGSTINYACATFVPTDDDKVYIMAGRTGPTVFNTKVSYYSFGANDYTVVTNLPGNSLFNVGCSGFINPQGEMVLVIVGGDVESVGYTDEVKTYNINTDTWGTMAPYPAKIVSPHLVAYKGYLYSFGGLYASGNSKDIYKIPIDGSGPWTSIGSLSIGSFHLVVAAYN